MKAISQKKRFRGNGSRRNLIQRGGLLMATAGIAGLSGMTLSCSNRSSSGMGEEGSGEEEEMVSANEDLMREHGLLQRMMLIYDAAALKWSDGLEFTPVSTPPVLREPPPLPV